MCEVGGPVLSPPCSPTQPKGPRECASTPTPTPTHEAALLAARPPPLQLPGSCALSPSPLTLGLLASDPSSLLPQSRPVWVPSTKKAAQLSLPGRYCEAASVHTLRLTLQYFSFSHSSFIATTGSRQSLARIPAPHQHTVASGK